MNKQKDSLAEYPEGCTAHSAQRVYRIASHVFALAKALQEHEGILPTAERHAKADALYAISNELFQTIGKQDERLPSIRKVRKLTW